MLYTLKQIKGGIKGFMEIGLTGPDLPKGDFIAKEIDKNNDKKTTKAEIDEYLSKNQVLNEKVIEAIKSVKNSISKSYRSTDMFAKLYNKQMKEKLEVGVGKDKNKNSTTTEASLKTIQLQVDMTKGLEEGLNTKPKTDHTSAKNVEKILADKTSEDIGQVDNKESVNKLDSRLNHINIINSSLKAYLNKAEVQDYLKDSGSDIASFFQADDFMNYLENHDPILKQKTDTEKQKIKNSIDTNLPKLLETIKKQDFESQKIKNNILEGAIYYGVVGIPLMTLNISDSQKLEAPVTMTDAANFYDSIINGTDFVPSTKKEIEAEFNKLRNSTKEQKDQLIRSYLRNIDFSERQNISGSSFSWFEKNLPNWFTGDEKADEAQKIIGEYNALLINKDFDIKEAKGLIKKLNKTLGKQYNEETLEIKENVKQNDFRKYLDEKLSETDRFYVISAIKGENQEKTFEQLKRDYPTEFASFEKNFKVNEIRTKYDDKEGALKRANNNLDSILKGLQDQAVSSGKDLTVYNEVLKNNNKDSTKLAAISVIFDINKLGIQNLLNAHPIISPTLEARIKAIDFKDAKSIIAASADKEVKDYMIAIQDPKEYNTYFIKELSKLKGAKDISKDVKKGRFGEALGTDKNLKRWSEILATTGTTDGISTLTNISQELAKATGLQVTPAELKTKIASGRINKREKTDFVLNFNKTGKITNADHTANKLTTLEYVTFPVEKTYEVFTEDGKKMKITESIPVDIKTDCANLNIDKDKATYKIEEISGNNGISTEITLDEAMTRVETGKFVVPLVGVSLLGAFLKTGGNGGEPIPKTKVNQGNGGPIARDPINPAINTSTNNTVFKTAENIINISA